MRSCCRCKKRPRNIEVATARVQSQVVNNVHRAVIGLITCRLDCVLNSNLCSFKPKATQVAPVRPVDGSTHKTKLDVTIRCINVSVKGCCKTCCCPHRTHAHAAIEHDITIEGLGQGNDVARELCRATGICCQTVKEGCGTSGAIANRTTNFCRASRIQVEVVRACSCGKQGICHRQITRP